MDIPWDKLLSQDPIENIQGIGDLLKPAHDAVCQLYESAPAWSLGPIGAAGSGFGLNKLIFDTLCPHVPAPPPPTTSSFTGGQCSIGYNIEAKVSFHNDPGNTTGTMDYKGTATGPIAGTRIQANIWTSGQTPPTIYIKNQSGQDCGSIDWSPGGTYQGGTFPQSGQNGVIDSASIMSVSPIGNVPDNCGNATGAAPPTPPPDSARNSSGNITLNNGNTVNWNIKNDFDPSLLSNNNFLSIPVKIYLNADVSFHIPVTFSWGNVNFNFSGDGQHYQNDASGAAAQTNNNFTANFNATANTLANFGVAINNINNNVNNAPPGPGTKTPTPKTPSDPKKTTSKNYLYAVEVHLTSIPENARTQKGIDGPDVIYCGWFEFSRDGDSFPREPIHFKDGIFLAPNGADGYAYTLYTGFDGYAVEITNTVTTTGT